MKERQVSSYCIAGNNNFNNHIVGLQVDRCSQNRIKRFNKAAMMGGRIVHQVESKNFLKQQYCDATNCLRDIHCWLRTIPAQFRIAFLAPYYLEPANTLTPLL